MLRSFSCLRPRSNARGKRNSLQIILNVDYLIHPKIFCCFLDTSIENQKGKKVFRGFLHEYTSLVGVAVFTDLLTIM